MGSFGVPLISREDYDAFRRILNRHLPDTYDEWPQFRSREITERHATGYTSIDVQNLL
jgi:hypothetical protein